MKRLTCISLLAAVALLFGAVRSATAEDVYFVDRLRNLTITEGELPEDRDAPTTFGFSRRAKAMRPYASLEGDGEIYVVAEPIPSLEPQEAENNPGIQPEVLGRANQQRSNPWIAVRVPHRREIRAKIFLPKADESGMAALSVAIPTGEGGERLKKGFFRVKRAHFENLLEANVAGAAWFRHQTRSATRALGEQRDEQRQQRRSFRTTRTTEMENTYALFSGGRAVSENLQLDRMLPGTEPDEATVALDSIEGITVREFDWEELTKHAKPQLDPLASLVPDDQHALFFSSFSALVKLVDAAEEYATPVLRATAPPAEDALSLDRYQRQLCLPLRQAERWLGPQVTKSVAITGGDPYFRTGTDVAVLLEAKNLQTLSKTMETRVSLTLQEQPEAEAVEGKIHGVAYFGARSPDRSICCYVASLGDAVIVANSLKQLERIVAVHSGEESPLASLPEYTFFRDRYPPTDEEESALLVISDKTIRRWCGPRWRIAASRRTRAAAVMAEMQAAHLERLVAGELERSEIEAEFWVPEADRFTLTNKGMRSSVYGDLHFQTPIHELDLAYVTKEEAELYRRWRTGYQRNWSNFFDPIAVQFSGAADKVAVDLTVMPLIDSSVYQQWVGISRGAKLQPHDGDPHPEALAHFVLALNLDSERLNQYGNFAEGMLQVNPLRWIGNSVALYTDRGPFFHDWDAAEDRNQFLRENFHRLPVALHVDVRSGLKLMAFLTGLRGFIEQTAPDMTVWEKKTHNDEPYVKISSSDRARRNPALDDQLDDLAIYYAASGQGLTIALHESVLHQALDRQKARRNAGDKPQAPEGVPPWIGDNLSLRVDGDAMTIVQAGWGDTYRRAMQAQAWGNLPILNEWQRLFPDHDGVELHEQYWGTRPVCPGGGLRIGRASQPVISTSGPLGRYNQQISGASRCLTKSDVACEVNTLLIRHLGRPERICQCRGAVTCWEPYASE